MKIRTVIIDDEQNNIDNLSILLRTYCPVVEIVSTARNAEEGKMIINGHEPDLVFLDIQMPVTNGFEMLRQLPGCSFELIFVTAYDQYGIQAVKFSAIDYLLKPIDLTELMEAIRKVSQRTMLKKQNLQLTNLLSHLTQQKELHKIALASTKEVRFIEPDRIMRCMSANNYTTFFLNDGGQIMTSRPIHEYEELLKEYNFLRIHQSHLINKRYVRSWVKEDGGYILMEDLAQVPVSRNKREEIRNLFP